MPTANRMSDNQSLTIGVVKLNYTIRPFLSGIVLPSQENCKKLSGLLGLDLVSSCGVPNEPCFIESSKI